MAKKKKAEFEANVKATLVLCTLCGFAMGLMTQYLFEVFCF